MHHGNKSIPILILILFIISSCKSVEMFKEKTEFKPYNSYKTFAILNKEVGYKSFEDNFLDAMVSTRLQEEFEAIGLTYEKENPEIIIRFTSNEDPREKELYNNRYPMWGGRIWDPWMFDPLFAQRQNYVTTKDYHLLQLIVDFIDPKKDQMLMRLTAVSETSSPKDKIKKLSKSVNSVTKSYVEHLNNLAP
jgi:hypothetical protein